MSQPHRMEVCLILEKLGRSIRRSRGSQLLKSISFHHLDHSKLEIHQEQESREEIHIRAVKKLLPLLKHLDMSDYTYILI